MTSNTENGSSGHFDVDLKVPVEHWLPETGPSGPTTLNILITQILVPKPPS